VVSAPQMRVYPDEALVMYSRKKWALVLRSSLQMFPSVTSGPPELAREVDGSRGYLVWQSHLYNPTGGFFLLSPGKEPAMRWRRRQRSKYLRDERSASAARPGLPMGLAGGGIGGVLLLVLWLFLGGGGGSTGGSAPSFPALDQFPAAPAAPAGESLPGAPDPEAELVDFVSFVLDDVQATWADVFRRSGKTYRPAELVLFRQATNTACGYATSDVGPFYCPADETVYLDLGFFAELRDRFGARGDFAQAYVIAHEIAHHVQNLLGIDDRARRLESQDPSGANEVSVMQELQADCFAGVWGYSTYERGILEAGDLREGLNAAAAVGDDRIQQEATGRIDPDTWTHGSAAQRTEWFERGFNTGDASSCDTFSLLGA
jgi:predicted metalloprotease